MKKIYLVILLVVIAAAAAVLLFAPEGGEQAQQQNPAQQALPEGHPDVNAMQQGMGAPQQGMGGMQEGDEAGPSKSNVRKEFYEELEALRRKVDADPNAAAADMRKLADLLVMSHKPAEAIPYFKRLAKADPKDTEVLLALASAHSQLREYAASLDVTRRILRIDPKSTLAMYNLGVIQAQLGRKDEARQTWQKLIDDYPASADAARATTALGRL